MINLTLFAAILLALRIISVAFLGYVLFKQHKTVNEHLSFLNDTRSALLFFSTTLVLADVMPIIIDTMAIVGSYNRQPVSLVGILYAFPNASFAAIAGIGWWRLYRIANRDKL